MDLRASTEGEWTILDVEGDVDGITAPALRARLAPLVDRARPHVIIRLDDRSFVDSTGFGVLVRGYRAAKRHAGSLKVVTKNRSVRRFIDLTGLDRVIPVHDSVEQLDRR